MIAKPYLHLSPQKHRQSKDVADVTYAFGRYIGGDMQGTTNKIKYLPSQVLEDVPGKDQHNPSEVVSVVFPGLDELILGESMQPKAAATGTSYNYWIMYFHFWVLTSDIIVKLYGMNNSAL